MTPCTVYYFLCRHGMVEGSMLFVKIVIYDRIKIPNSKELFFYLATVGFFVYIESASIWRPIEVSLKIDRISRRCLPGP